MPFKLFLTDNDMVERVELTPPPEDAHKYDRGHAFIISGPPLSGGATRLAALAALGVGAGLTSIIGREQALVEHAAHMNAVMLRRYDPGFSAIHGKQLAVAIGPAAGVNDEVAADLLVLLQKNFPIVIDADGLTCFAMRREEFFAGLHEKAVLTPHRGEFSRIFPEVDLADPVKAVKSASILSGAVVLLKGAETYIAAPDGRIAVNRHSASWLATAGSGDVLTGLICGVMAQGVPAFEAAAIGAWLHGDIAINYGPGLTADIMIGQIPLVLRGCLTE